MRITAAILCGGQGTRLRSVIGDNLPKCLAPVAGRPFIDYVVDHLMAQKVKRIVFCVGYCGEQIENYIDDAYNPLDIEIRSTKELTPLGTGGCLRNALPFLDTDPVLVLNGDTFCKFDLASLLSHYNGFANTLTCENSTCLNNCTGVKLLSQKLLKSLPEGYSALDGVVGQVLAYDGLEFIDIGTPQGYAGAEAFLRQQGVVETS